MFVDNTTKQSLHKVLLNTYKVIEYDRNQWHSYGFFEVGGSTPVADQGITRGGGLDEWILVGMGRSFLCA